MNMRGIPRYALVWGARYTLGARYLSKNTVNHSSWWYICVRTALFFIVSRVPQFPSLISFEQVLLVCSSSVHHVCIDLQSVIRDVSRSNRCSGKKSHVLLVYCATTGWH